ncbi:MAG: hypothetical protein ABIR79_03370 [Candidatus Binatia bacterium]
MARSAIGGIIGFLVAKLSTFVAGMGVGMIIPGLVSLAFTYAFVEGYRVFSYDAARTTGVVVAVEDRAANASGSVTSPVAIVEYDSDPKCRLVTQPRRRYKAACASSR